MVELIKAIMMALLIIAPMSIMANISRSTGVAFLLGILAEFMYLLIIDGIN